MHAPDAAEALRIELKGLLADIDDEIRTGFPVSSSELTRRTSLAELSIVRDLMGLLRLALVGEDRRGRIHASRFSTPGQAYDLRDSLAVAARSVVNERQRRESELATLQAAPWPAELRVSFQSLIDDERRVCEFARGLGEASREHGAALRALVKDLCDVCLTCLMQAAAVYDQQQRRGLGEAAFDAAERATCAWLVWRSSLEARSGAAWRACAPVRVPSDLVGAAATDERCSCFLEAIRRTLHLRREQDRLLAAQRRLLAVLSAAEALASLQARVVVP